MKILLPFMLFVSLACTGQPGATISGRPAAAVDRPVLFDAGWKFCRGGVEQGQSTGLSDSSWRTVDLPHDWSIENLSGTNSPFSPDAISQVGGGFTTGGTGWYRKTFVIPETRRNGRVRIVFDGVYMNADVWLNGEWLGNHPYGYTGFSFDITAALHPAGDNVIAVQVKNEGQNSRWYAGSGIYRHVWLQYSGETAFRFEGTRVSTAGLTAAAGPVHVRSFFERHTAGTDSLYVRYSLVDATGDTLRRQQSPSFPGADSTGEIRGDLSIANPVFWSPDRPVLYTLVSDLFAGGRWCARDVAAFGFRTIAFTADKGFLLNGVTTKLKGGCYHNDNGPLGARAFDRAEIRRVELLKASGFNAIRCSHNPPPPAFLDACDRLGMLVIDEAFDMWEEGKNPYDYHLYFKDNWKKDIESMIFRDLNHPSVIMWSIGNEIPNREKPAVVATARALAAFVHSLDTTRPVTAAVNGDNPDKDPFFSTLGIGGYNYAFDQYEKDHARVPGRIMMGTESYALEAFDYWMAVTDHPYVIGDFIWTGFDYIGEASIGWRGYMQEKAFYPWTLAFCGDIDICGWKRPQSYYRDALWKKDQLSLFVRPPVPSFPENPRREAWSKWQWFDAVPEWNWAGSENKPLDVTVYASCETVELRINGRSLGKKPTNRATRFMATWSVPYVAGSLEAIGYRNNKPIQRRRLVTAATPALVHLAADRAAITADGQDLCYVTVTLEDAARQVAPNADRKIHFQLDGPGTIVALGNANPVSTESYEGSDRTTWKGKCLVVIRSSMQAGRLQLRASDGTLPMATVDITSR